MHTYVVMRICLDRMCRRDGNERINSELTYDTLYRICTCIHMYTVIIINIFLALDIFGPGSDASYLDISLVTIVG